MCGDLTLLPRPKESIQPSALKATSPRMLKIGFVESFQIKGAVLCTWRGGGGGYSFYARRSGMKIDPRLSTMPGKFARRIFMDQADIDCLHGEMFGESHER